MIDPIVNIAPPQLGRFTIEIPIDRTFTPCLANLEGCSIVRVTGFDVTIAGRDRS